MKFQSLAVPVVILLIVIATIPGLSYSLSSSVTSHFNTISIIEESDFGLYSDLHCNSPWSGPAFGKGVVEISNVGGKKVIEKDLDVDLSGGGTPVYLKVPKDSGIPSLSFNLDYHGDDGALSSGCYITISLKESISGTLIGQYTVYLDGTSSSDPITVSDDQDHVYLIEAELHVLPSDDVVVGSELPYFDLEFVTETESFINGRNTIDFRYNIDDIVVGSDKHDWKNSTSNPIAVNGSTVYQVVSKGEDHFTSDNKGTSTILRADADHGYYIQLDLGTSNGKKFNFITVSVKTTAGIVLVRESTFKNTDGQYVIIGKNVIRQGSLDGTNPITMDGVEPFSGSELEIDISGVTGNSDKKVYVDFYLIRVPVTGVT